MRDSTVARVEAVKLGERLSAAPQHLPGMIRRIAYTYDEARAAYDSGIELAGNEAERSFLARRREALPG